MKIAIVYHSKFNHTRQVADSIAQGIKEANAEAVLYPAETAASSFDEISEADAIIFGSPTYMGSVSSEFKAFMEQTSKFWYSQKWKDKPAAAFTSSSTTNGDKFNTLLQIAVFAAQHSMLWIPTGILPMYENGVQLETPNGMAGYLGLMIMADNNANPPRDLETAVMFGKRIAEVTAGITLGTANREAALYY